MQNIMMNKFLLLASILCALFLCSCSDFENEVWINEDGSGKMAMNYDMSPMLSMAAMAEGFKNAADSTQNGAKVIEKEDNANELLSIMDGISDPTKLKNIDTTFNLYEVMPDSIKQKVDNPKLLEKVSISMLTNKDQAKALMGLEISYDQMSQLEEIFLSLSKLSEASNKQQTNLEGLKEMMRSYEIDLKNGIITFPEQNFEDALGEGLSQIDQVDLDNMTEEEKAMMQMMLGESGMTMKVNLPGEVLSCNDPSAKIEGNTVYFKDSFVDLVEKKKLKERVIKFKR